MLAAMTNDVICLIEGHATASTMWYSFQCTCGANCLKNASILLESHETLGPLLKLLTKSRLRMTKWIMWNQKVRQFKLKKLFFH